ncbi:MAG: TetR/AcrR family transcriptional regulator [Armatimonadetes bacterium]|nr:TetR/AcrR family transcriptional regulator [Armatimonadota bacterium]
MSPRIVDRAERQREIGLAALDVFAERGFEGASMSEIAKAAGVSKGALYLYFESKEDLILQAVAAWTEQFLQETQREVPDHLPPEQRLRSVVHAMVEVFVPDERSLKIAAAMFQLYVTNPKLWAKYQMAREMFQGARKLVSDIILEGVSTGAFRPEAARQAEKAAINLIAFLDGIALHHYMSNRQINLGEQVDFYVDTLLASLRVEDRRQGAAS